MAPAVAYRWNLELVHADIFDPPPTTHYSEAATTAGKKNKNMASLNDTQTLI